jgi:catechol 2,3-dioxygenase-like lactoylglutathione lyase family enzyme
MITAIESVTVAVSDLASSARLLEEQLGLIVVGDARASVGHLSAWRHPVHESVRLVELGGEGLAVGRVRLARVEDAARERNGPVERRLLPGPKLLDFRAGPAAEAPTILQGLDGVPLLCPPPSAMRARPGHRLRSVWVVTSDGALACRFYTDVLGFVVACDAQAPAPRDIDLVRTVLPIPAGATVQAVAYNAAGRHEGGVVVLHVPELPETQPLHSISLPSGGIRLLTCQCDDLDSLAARLHAFGIEPLSPPQHIGLPTGTPGLVMVARGPSEELFEFIEIAP